MNILHVYFFPGESFLHFRLKPGSDFRNVLFRGNEHFSGHLHALSFPCKISFILLAIRVWWFLSSLDSYNHPIFQISALPSTAEFRRQRTVYSGIRYIIITTATKEMRLLLAKFFSLQVMWMNARQKAFRLILWQTQWQTHTYTLMESFYFSISEDKPQWSIPF